MAGKCTVSEQNTSLPYTTSSKRKLASGENTPTKSIDFDILQKFALWIQEAMSTKIRMFLIDISGKKADIYETVNRIYQREGSDHRKSTLLTLSSVNQMLNLWTSRELGLYSAIQELESQVRDFTDTLCAAFIENVPISKLCKNLITPLDTECLNSQYSSNFRSYFEDILRVTDEAFCVQVTDEVEKYKFKVISTVTFADINVPDRLFIDNGGSAEFDMSSPSG